MIELMFWIAFIKINIIIAPPLIIYTRKISKLLIDIFTDIKLF